MVFDSTFRRPCWCYLDADFLSLSVSSTLEIRQTTGMTSLAALFSLEFIGAHLIINANRDLESLDGLWRVEDDIQVYGIPQCHALDVARRFGDALTDVCIARCFQMPGP
jgi:hypothetical protein